VDVPRQETNGALATLAVFRRRWPVVVLCTLAGIVGAFFYVHHQPRKYSATSTLLFRDPEFDQTLFGSTFFQPTTDPTQQTATNVGLVALESVAAWTANQVHDGLTAREISHDVTVASDGDSTLANVTATDTSPRRAADLANAYAQAFVAFRRNADRSKVAQAVQLLQTQLLTLQHGNNNLVSINTLRQRLEQLQVLEALQTGNAEVVQPAGIPISPSSPRVLLDLVLGGIVGLLAGLALAFAIDLGDRRFRDATEIADAFGRPLLAQVPFSSSATDHGSPPGLFRREDAEAFWMLRANLRYFNVSHPITSVLVTSSGPAEGKTTVSANLAAAIGESGQKTLLIDVDLRHRAAAQLLGVDQEPGLSNVLAADISMKDAILPATLQDDTDADIHARSFDFLPAGAMPPNPADLVDSPQMVDVLTQAHEEYDMVILDTTPTSLVSDAIPLLSKVSAVIAVARLGTVTRDDISALRRQFEHLGTPVLGLVVNFSTTPRGYGYQYGSVYGDSQVSNGADAKTPDDRKSTIRQLLRR
jgi:polysaccharide biosynthesis transport protein